MPLTLASEGEQGYFNHMDCSRFYSYNCHNLPRRGIAIQQGRIFKHYKLLQLFYAIRESPTDSEKCGYS